MKSLPNPDDSVFMDIEASALNGGYPVAIALYRSNDTFYKAYIYPTENWLQN